MHTLKSSTKKEGKTTYKGMPMSRRRKTRDDVLKVLKENHFQLEILYPAKLSAGRTGGMKTCSDVQGFGTLAFSTFLIKKLPENWEERNDKGHANPGSSNTNLGWSRR